MFATAGSDAKRAYLRELGVPHVLGRLGRATEAEAAYREAVRRDPELAAAHVNLAMLLEFVFHRDGEVDDVAAQVVDAGIRAVAQR